MADLLNFKDKYKIAPNGLSPEVLELARQRGAVPSPAQLTGGAIADFLRPSGSRPGDVGYEARAMGLMPEVAPTPKPQVSAQDVSSLIAPQEPIASFPTDVASEEVVPAAPVEQVAESVEEEALSPYVQSGLDVASAEQRGLMDQSRILSSLDKELSDRRSRFEAARKSASNQLNEELTTLKKLQDDYNSGEITNYWDTKSGGEKFLATLAMAAGAFGSGLNRGPNYAMQLINKEIDSHIDREKTRLNKSKGAIDIQNNIIGNIRQTVKDNALADDISAQMLTQSYKNRLERSILNTKNEQAKAGMGQLLVQLDAQEKALGAEIQSKMLNNYKSAIEINALAGQAQEIPDETKKRIIPGLGVAIRDEDVPKIKEQNVAAYQAIPIVDDLLNLTEEQFKSLPSETRSVIEQNVNILTGKLRVPVVGPGAFTDSERAFIKNDIVGNPSAILSFDNRTRAKLRNLKKILIKSRDATASAYGIEPFTAREKAFSDSLIGAEGFIPYGADKDVPSGGESQRLVEIQSLKQQYQERLRNNPNDQVARQRLQAIEARGL